MQLFFNCFKKKNIHTYIKTKFLSNVQTTCQLQATCNLEVCTHELSIYQHNEASSISIVKAELWTGWLLWTQLTVGCREYMHESVEYCYIDTPVWSKVVKLHQITCRPISKIPCQLSTNITCICILN